MVAVQYTCVIDVRAAYGGAHVKGRARAIRSESSLLAVRTCVARVSHATYKQARILSGRRLAGWPVPTVANEQGLYCVKGPGGSVDTLLRPRSLFEPGDTANTTLKSLMYWNTLIGSRSMPQSDMYGVFVMSACTACSAGRRPLFTCRWWRFGPTFFFLIFRKEYALTGTEQLTC
ncbi:hypothetical protein PENSPDRAFT_61715 [Peniophora sp. CONT]|nr:hypothetical protein PENSPDRAFT_61715 [Peniophora sp. CONT]